MEVVIERSVLGKVEERYQEVKKCSGGDAEGRDAWRRGWCATRGRKL